DENDVRDLLIEVPADPEGVVRLDRAELLRRLRWEQRMSLRSRHEFPVEEQAYEPIVQTVDELNEKLEHLDQGYLAVLGSPGSGKSTLVTTVLRTRAERFVPYYAYVPDSPSPLTTRGESANFLHDIV